jgi:hypothetical protein
MAEGSQKACAMVEGKNSQALKHAFSASEHYEEGLLAISKGAGFNLAR